MELIIFTGIQASGKSSFYKQRFSDTHIRINLDMLRTRHREKLLVNACFEMKQPFVIDNTNLTIEERKVYIKNAKKHHFHISSYYFLSDFTASQQRNARRQGKACIPEVGIKSALRKLQIPSFSEGFDEMHRVTLQNDHFIIEEIYEI